MCSARMENAVNSPFDAENSLTCRIVSWEIGALVHMHIGDIFLSNHNEFVKILAMHWYFHNDEMMIIVLRKMPKNWLFLIGCYIFIFQAKYVSGDQFKTQVWHN